MEIVVPGVGFYGISNVVGYLMSFCLHKLNLIFQNEFFANK